MLSRRGFVVGAAGLVLAGMRAPWMYALAGTPITIYKSKTCGCCSKWVDHVKAAGFDTKVHDEEEMDQLKDELGVPGPVRSCHTALVGAYLIEGHVPASDIRRLLAERPKVVGLAVPGMPAGSPGMAAPGKEGDYKVVAFQSDGSTRPFASH
ncbi:MAG TPA: DUF411 domain-containing protein [Gemmatimonadales bacterium]|nr:DUF411 domain-containing protein [Gemmatimonadales bacterium]